MKKLISVIIMLFSLCISAEAFDDSSLPLYLTFSEAIGITNVNDIKSASVININEEKTARLSDDQISKIFTDYKNIKLKRTINPTPFSGIALSIEISDGITGFYSNSGVQIGKYGSNNYICYVPEDVSNFAALLSGMYYDAEYYGDMYTFPVNEERDFLKLPTEAWAIDGIKYSASKSLLPYEITGNYSKNITREEFCILMGNMIAVFGNYKSISDYMRDNKTIYQKNYFTDCPNADPSVDILHTLGIISGKTDTTFEPNSFVSREEASKMISRSAELFIPLYTAVEVDFADKQNISDWASFYVQWCNEHSIMMGDENKNFSPKSNLTVQEAVVCVSRVFDMLERNRA